MSLVRGWCPGALRPMESGDGWLLRVRPPLQELTGAQVHGLADLAEAHGATALEVTRRANLQLRGLGTAALPGVQEGLAGLGLLDPDLPPETEGRINILIDPFWPDDDARLMPALWSGLRSALVAPGAPRLPAKFGFALDPGPEARHLMHESGDIRIEASADGGLMVRADGAMRGRMVHSPQAAVDLAVAMAEWFVASGGVGPDGRGRMRDHIARGAALPAGLAGDAEPVCATPIESILDRIVGFDFGSIRPADFRSLVPLTGPPLRLTPWRGVHLAGVSQAAVASLGAGFITGPHDPRHRRFACVGAPACPQGLGAPRELAARLNLLPPPGKVLHISGCAKGCAHPGPADLTLTCARDGLLVAPGARAGQGQVSEPGRAGEILHEVFGAPHL